MRMQIWATGDVSNADQIMDKNVDLYNVVYGGCKKGVEDFKSMVTGIFKVCLLFQHLTASLHVLAKPTN